MKISNVKKLLTFSMKNNFPVLLTGSPGIGKTSIVEEAAKEAGFRVIFEFLTTSDPIDFKGALFAENGKADFLPAGNLNDIVDTDEKIVYFLDDIGQATVAVQSAAMQLIHARRIGEKRVGKNVVFMGATNRAHDGAGVSYLIEPLKSRFRTIIELSTSVEDWIDWANRNNMPSELIGFIRFRPEMLNNFKPTRDLTNSSNPRSVAGIGDMMNKGLEPTMMREVFSGAAGEAFSTEFMAFLMLQKEIPDLDAIIKNPKTAPVPEKSNMKYAVYSALSSRMSVKTFKPIVQYTERMGVDLVVAVVKDAVVRSVEIQESAEFGEWAYENEDLFKNL